MDLLNHNETILWRTKKMVASFKRQAMISKNVMCNSVTIILKWYKYHASKLVNKN